MKKFITSELIRFAVKDHYETGCECNGHESIVSLTFSGNTLDELYTDIKEFFGLAGLDCVLDASSDLDETNRIEIQVLENGSGTEASDNEIDLWKAEKIELYACNYTLYVYEVTPVNIHDQEAQ